MAICSTMDHDGWEILDGDRSKSYSNMVDYLYQIISHPILSILFTILSNLIYLKVFFSSFLNNLSYYLKNKTRFQLSSKTKS
jgi:hypothetical protein